ncbi:MAG: DUF91 domain-containing protein [Candidatus Omnitrophota bacterium]|jgi:hypothetical protein|nr:MAG: DUF91 domain-containing protein [Candidatus Omnitrophota bacterium]
MRLFTLDETGKMFPYNEIRFKEENREADLETILDNNPEYFFESSRILMIGRQITTNLNSCIDLLGIDGSGNTVVIELKRDKTPRETIAQLLEYASFVENLNYTQLDEIFQNYLGEAIGLEAYHQQFFQNANDTGVSFNKCTKLIIVAQKITAEIKQTAYYLRKQGLDIYCFEFRYFTSKTGEKILTNDMIVGNEESIRREVQSASLPKIDEPQFRKSLDRDGLRVFDKISNFAKNHRLFFRWGSKGFSLNMELENSFVGLFFGYPPHSVFKQSIYTGFEEIRKKVYDPENIVDFYRSKLESLGYFIKAQTNIKWMIDSEYQEERVENFLVIVEQVISRIKTHGLQIRSDS